MILYISALIDNTQCMPLDFNVCSKNHHSTPENCRNVIVLIAKTPWQCNLDYWWGNEFSFYGVVEAITSNDEVLADYSFSIYLKRRINISAVFKVGEFLHA